MQQTSFQDTSKINQPEFKRVLRIAAFLCVLGTLVGVSALGTNTGSDAPNEAASTLPSVAAAFATPHSSGLLNGMPLP
jgi:hypothetical protein